MPAGLGAVQGAVWGSGLLVAVDAPRIVESEGPRGGAEADRRFLEQVKCLDESGPEADEADGGDGAHRGVIPRVGAADAGLARRVGGNEDEVVRGGPDGQALSLPVLLGEPPGRDVVHAGEDRGRKRDQVGGALLVEAPSVASDSEGISGQVGQDVGLEASEIGSSSEGVPVEVTEVESLGLDHANLAAVAG